MAKKINLALEDGTILKILESWNKFARNFALTGNAAKSRIDAGYTSNKNKSIDAIHAYKLFQKKEVQTAYEFHKRQLAKKIDISENRILAEMAAIGFSNLANMFKDGSIKDIEDADKATQRSIKSIKIKRYMAREGSKAQDHEVIAVEMHPKLPALKEIAEIKGMNQAEKNRPISVTVNIDGKEAKTTEKSKS